MKDTVLKQAKVWGFICQKDTQGTWQILPQQPTERWQMRLIEDRWLLIVGNVPQINFYPHEAIAFLELRRS
ncbi:hypothetical protein [Allocoleopsis sp.]|uniref:hypothetical protein n=1 Tax=Allocoleopsis sp. TaxID=3088169 RepID=UPI002FD6D775